LCVVASSQVVGIPCPSNERTAIKDVFDRIDTAGYFEGAQGAICPRDGPAHPELELIQLSDAEAQKWEKTMREAGVGTLEGLDPEL
jgi:hypothetical protein